jgi:uncharacterized protein (TIGR02594 family)
MSLWRQLMEWFTQVSGAVPQNDYPSWLAIAESQMGTCEIDGPLANQIIKDYHAATSLKAVSDEVPWCSSFVNWAMGKAGIKGTNSAAARSWEKWGVEDKPPKIGSVAVLSRGSNPTLGHVGFFMGYVTGKKVSILGGNQGDCVSIDNFPASRVVTFRWPK